MDTLVRERNPRTVGRPHIPTHRDYAVNPAELHAAAQRTRAAAKQDEAASQTFESANSDGGAFGRSGPAISLARRWNDAVRARAVEADDNAERTNQMATELDGAAGEYTAMEETNGQRLNGVGGQ